MEKHDTVSRKFIKTINIDNYEVLTDTGWVDIKRVNQTIPYEIYVLKTKQHQLECADNHIVFMSNMCEVFVKDLKPHDLILTDNGEEEVISVERTGKYENMYDLELSDSSNHRFFMNGILSHNSSTYCMYVLWLTCFHSDKRVMMLAQKEATALELLDRIKTGYEYLPTWLKPGCVEFNKSSVKFSNRSTIMGFSASAQGARGQSCNCLILDEFAFVPPQICDALFTAVYPVVSSSKNGKVIIVSTPNGKQNLYYDIWKKANNKDDPDNVDGWRAFRMDWWQIPGRDEKWKQAQIAAIGPTRFAQEFNNEFLDDVTTVKLISDEISDRYRVQLTEFKAKGINQGKALFITSPDGKKTYPFVMYHDFDPKRTYLASGDVAEGVGKDSSTLYIWDVTDLSNIRMCCKFSDDKTSILEFAFVAKEILKLYANPFIACESNGISLGFIEQLRVTYAYENFIKMNKGGCGIDSNMYLKTKACLWTRDMLTTVGFGFELYDADLIDEFSSFTKKDTKVHTVYAAIKGSHDDHIMAFIWMCWILNPENVEKYFIVKSTFRNSTGVIFPKQLIPYEEYTPSEIEYVQNSEQIKDFRFYKSKLNNEFLLDHEKKVEQQKKIVEEQIVQESNDVAKQRFKNKNVLSESELIQMMRDQTGGRGEQNGGSSSIGSTGLGFGGSSGYFGSAGNIITENPDTRNLNVEWSSWDTSNGNGIDSLFGFEDNEFDGPEW